MATMVESQAGDKESATTSGGLIRQMPQWRLDHHDDSAGDVRTGWRLRHSVGGQWPKAGSQSRQSVWLWLGIRRRVWRFLAPVTASQPGRNERKVLGRSGTGPSPQEPGSDQPWQRCLRARGASSDSRRLPESRPPFVGLARTASHGRGGSRDRQLVGHPAAAAGPFMGRPTGRPFVRRHAHRRADLPYTGSSRADDGARS